MGTSFCIWIQSLLIYKTKMSNNCWTKFLFQPQCALRALKKWAGKQHQSTIFIVKSKQFVIPSWLGFNWQFWQVSMKMFILPQISANIVLAYSTVRNPHEQIHVNHRLCIWKMISHLDVILEMCKHENKHQSNTITSLINCRL